MKQAIELIVITLYGAGSDVMWSLKWEEPGRPGENSRVRTGDHRTLSHTPRRGSNQGGSGDIRVANHCDIRTP